MTTFRIRDDAADEYGLLMTGGVEIKSNLSAQDMTYLIRDGFRVLRRRVIVVEDWRELSAEDARRLAAEEGLTHLHGTSEPGWQEHNHLGGGIPHEHDPETGFQMPPTDTP